MATPTYNQRLPMQLMAASFASGAALAYVYSRYIQRVSQTSSSRRNSPFNNRTTSNIDPIAAMFNQNDISIEVLNRKFCSISNSKVLFPKKYH
jgi:hypothetical protein